MVIKGDARSLDNRAYVPKLFASRLTCGSSCQVHMSHSLDSSKGFYRRLWGSMMRGYICSPFLRKVLGACPYRQAREWGHRAANQAVLPGALRRCTRGLRGFKGGLGFMDRV